MEKLKPIHDHKLTDIVKVGIFTLMLLLPFLVFLPNAFYYGFNEHAVIGQEETYYNFYQGVKNGKPYNLDYIDIDGATDISIVNGTLHVAQEGNSTNNIDIYYDTDIVFNKNDYYYYSFNILVPAYSDDIYFNFYNDDLGLLQEDYLLTNNSLNKYTQYNTANVSFNNLSVSNIQIYGEDIDGIYFDVSDLQIFNLTTIFGSGNEPTQQQFENMLTQNYYNYGNNYVLKDKGTNITWSMYNGWEDIWQTPLFSWTNQSILNTGLVAFSNVFGITKTSYITNFITYELVMVAIYIVLDIVLTLFKWLTHIGQKE